MVFRLRPILLGILMTVALLPLAGQDPALPSGFSGTALSQAHSEPLALLFIGEQGGFLSAYDLEKRAVIFRYQAALNPISRIACHPSLPEIALVASDGIGRHSLLILGIEGNTVREISNQSLNDEPEGMAYSPKGGYLALCSRNAAGVLLIETKGYASLEGFPTDCGPSSFVTIGNSENSLLHYAPKGRLTYRSLPDGKVIAEAKTYENLSGISLAADKKSFFALSSGNLVRIDAMSGREISGPIQKGVTGFCLSKSDGSCLCSLANGRFAVVKANGGVELSAETFDRFVSIQDSGSSVSCLSAKGILSIAGKGTVLSFQAVMAEPFQNISQVTENIFPDQRGFLITADSGLFALGEDSFWNTDGQPSPLVLLNGLEEPRFMAFFGEDRLFLSTGKAKLSALICLDGEARSSQSFKLSDTLKRLNGGPYGSVFILENESYGTINASKGPKPIATLNGIQDAALVSEDRIAIGRNKGGSLMNPLLFYSLQTGEISPSGLNAISVFRILPLGSGRFAALSIEELDGNTMTVARQCASQPFSSRILAKVPGEHFSADLALDGSGTLCIEMGDARSLLAWTEGSEPRSIPLDAYPRALASGLRGIFVEYADGSFGLVDVESAELSDRMAISGAKQWFRIPRQGARR
jgi:hypothetical protein